MARPIKRLQAERKDLDELRRHKAAILEKYPASTPPLRHEVLVVN